MRHVVSLLREWTFRRLSPEGSPEPSSVVDLPHSPKVVDLDGREPWFGICEYRRALEVPPEFPRGRIALYIGAAMHTATVYIDDKEVGQHIGGYLPFEIDLTDTLGDGRRHELILRLDNRENPEVPPGKPFAELDFSWHGGLYRDAELRTYPEVYISDPVAANVVASGGVFIRTRTANAQAATIEIDTHVCNARTTAECAVSVHVAISRSSRIIAEVESGTSILAPRRSGTLRVEVNVPQPALWQPEHPQLYSARVVLRARDGTTLDERIERFGIRTLHFSRSAGFLLNGRKLRLRGVNRHQEYPYVGYAVPPAAQYRDAVRIKEAGFDYVRLSHYPQSPAFLDACDELGLLVMNSIPGWQFLGGERFRRHAFQNARDLIRRDRNHPSVVLWELSLNETPMDDAFMDELHRIGHEEYPGGQFYTCGWMDRYDVYIHSRQHGEIHRWSNGDKALVIAEYGDWEFYASNRGFDQKTGTGRFADWSHGRHLRGGGERGLRQQAINHVIALNDTLSSPAVLDGLWSMFDYTRGYDAQRAACGIMDVFRLPKFSYYLFRSQRDVKEAGQNWSGGPCVHIASHWQSNSDLRLIVFSNCDELELRLNGTSMGRRKPDRAWMTQFLPHPPFVFELPAFQPGTLEAVGYCDDRAVASHRVTTPAAAEQLEIAIDDCGVRAAHDEPDLLFAHAEIRGAGRTLSVSDTTPVRFEISADATIVGPSEIVPEAGIASVLLHIPANCLRFALTARRVAGEKPLEATQVWQRGAATLATPPFPTSSEGDRRTAQNRYARTGS